MKSPFENSATQQVSAALPSTVIIKAKKKYWNGMLNP